MHAIDIETKELDQNDTCGHCTLHKNTDVLAEVGAAVGQASLKLASLLTLSPSWI